MFVRAKIISILTSNHFAYKFLTKYIHVNNIQQYPSGNKIILIPNNEYHDLF